MLSEEEEVLLAALQRGENEAFRILMRRYGSMLFGYAQRILNNADEAQEILQETMVSVFQHIGSFEKRCSLRSFLFRLVHHKAIDLIRRNRRYVALPDTPPYADAFDEKGGLERTAHHMGYPRTSARCASDAGGGTPADTASSP